MNSEYLESKGLVPDRDRYTLVYTFEGPSPEELSVPNFLNSVYDQFNNDHPDDYMGRSLSVSDVVVVRIGHELQAHYVDSFGFKELENFGEVHREAPQQENKIESVADVERRMAKKRLQEFDTIIARLYEDNVTGKITLDVFNKLSSIYVTEQAELQETVAVQSAKLAKISEQQSNIDVFLRAVKKYTEITELTPAILGEFVDKIVVHEKNKKHHIQKIDIYYKGVGTINNILQTENSDVSA